MIKKTKRKYSIGVFDSGFGGLQSLKHIVKELPEYDYVYLGDTARVPYGNRSQEEIYKFSVQATDFLFKKGCKLVIFACNTASSEALRKIQREYLPKKYPERKVLGIIMPAVEEAVSKTKNGRVGVIGTRGTVKSGAFERELKKLNPKIKVFQKACPDLAMIVENGKHKSEKTKIILEKYLKSLVGKKIGALILGCTHYGIMEKEIKNIIGNGIIIVSEEKVIAKKLKSYLERHCEIENKLAKNRKYTFYSTDITDKFKILGGEIFGAKIIPKKVKID